MKPVLAAIAVLATGPALAQRDPCAGALAPAAIVGCLRPDGLGATTRGIRPSRPAAPAPSIDLRVNFDFDSAVLTPQGTAALAALASALNDKALADANFLIGGHTDGAGSAAHNQALSERRAAAARAYLVERAGIAPARLTAAGFGFTRLYDPAHPLAAANRRVEVTRQ